MKRGENKMKDTKNLIAVDVREINFLGDTLLAAQDDEGGIWVAVN